MSITPVKVDPMLGADAAASKYSFQNFPGPALTKLWSLLAKFHSFLPHPRCPFCRITGFQIAL